MYFQIVSLEDLILNKPEREVYESLKDFSCSRNRELETFLLEKAIQFEKSHRSRTFLLLSDTKIEGFFTLSLNILRTKGLSNTRAKKLNPKYSKDDEDIPCFLIGQLARADGSEMNGANILNTSLFILEQARKLLGTKFVMLDSVNEKKVLDFYRKNGFVALNESDGAVSVKMVRMFD
ncbi:hypothetical protein [Helicobacter cinaedi]|uniref:hypothetical protein n=1 Tax=Helicobacter cinaedi TaxID=213 RepID=UPI000D7C8FBC|nr:hypothetical protein [Helicobacter cinaedi]